MELPSRKELALLALDIYEDFDEQEILKQNTSIRRMWDLGRKIQLEAYLEEKITDDRLLKLGNFAGLLVSKDGELVFTDTNDITNVLRNFIAKIILEISL